MKYRSSAILVKSERDTSKALAYTGDESQKDKCDYGSNGSGGGQYY